MSRTDLDKATLYEGVKTLIESPKKHILLNQQKLYTLFSISFQYMLYTSTKDPGHYIIRIEDSYLLDKLERRSKDDVTRKFLTKMALPRRLKYERSTFHLDFFNISSWAHTNELPKEIIKGALVVQNTNSKPIDSNLEEMSEEEESLIKSLPENYFVSTLQDFIPHLITIAFDKKIDGMTEIRFPFIKDEPREHIAAGVKIAQDIIFED